MAWQQIKPKEILLDKIKANGGWVNAHTHIDRSFIINDQNYVKTSDPLHLKWDHPDEFKKQVTVDEIVGHMSQVIENQLEQGVQALGSFIDCDSVVKDKNLKAAQIVKDRYGSQLKLKFIHQPVKGLMDKTEREWFEEAAGFVDIIGGLPERDSEVKIGEDRRAEHLDILFQTAKKHGKIMHVHIDQYNSPDQRDTELLIEKTREHDYAGKVVAIHAISVGSQPRGYRQKIYKDLKDLNIIVVACPSAWIDNTWIISQPDDVIGPIHNSLTPVKEMAAAGVKVALGTDDIADIYKPFSDGDMWTELRILLEAAHFYDMDGLAEIASNNGLKALGL
jgi:cytosine/creatinine deaminase